jgi:hypothetical protein
MLGVRRATMVLRQGLALGVLAGLTAWNPGRPPNSLGKRAISAVNVAREPIVDGSIEALGVAGMTLVTGRSG